MFSPAGLLAAITNLASLLLAAQPHCGAMAEDGSEVDPASETMLFSLLSVLAAAFLFAVACLCVVEKLNGGVIRCLAKQESRLAHGASLPAGGSSRLSTEVPEVPELAAAG